MSNRRKLNILPPRLALALLGSLLIHLLVLTGVTLEMPDLMADNDSLTVLLPPPPVEAKKPVVMPEPVPRQERPLRKKKKQESKQPKESPPPSPRIQEQMPDPVEPAVAASPVAVPEPVVEFVPEAEPVDESGSAFADAFGPADQAEASLAPRGYRRVTSEYRLYYNKGPSVGEVRHTYRAAADGTYRIVASAEASGLVSLFVRGKFVQQSDGMITDHGLKPQRFVYSRGDDADKEQKATFHWVTGMLTMESGRKRESTAPLIEGAQDVLSFMYQFMFVPPLVQMQLAVTNGKKFRVYSYAFEGEEILQTDIGNVRTLHIARYGNDGDEKIELWLAPDYRYLPVKISLTEKDGTVAVQIIKHIEVE